MCFGEDKLLLAASENNKAKCSVYSMSLHTHGQVKQICNVIQSN